MGPLRFPNTATAIFSCSEPSPTAALLKMTAVLVRASLWQEAQFVMVLIAVRPINSGDIWYYETHSRGIPSLWSQPPSCHVHCASLCFTVFLLVTEKGFLGSKMLAKGATHFWWLDNNDNNEDNYGVSSILEGGVTSQGIKRDNHRLNYRSGYQGPDYWSL